MPRYQDPTRVTGEIQKRGSLKPNQSEPKPMPYNNLIKNKMKWYKFIGAIATLIGVIWMVQGDRISGLLAMILGEIIEAVVMLTEISGGMDR